MGVDAETVILVVDDQLLAHGPTLAVKLDHSQGRNVFAVTQASQIVCQIEYEPIRASGWIPNEDDECVDGFLWIANVFNDPKRIEIMIANSRKDESGLD